MPNFYTDRHNNFLENADNIYNFLSGNYMDIYEGKLLECTEFSRKIHGIEIFSIDKFRKMETDQSLFDVLKKSVLGYLSSLHRNDCSACLFIVSNKDNVKLFFASETFDVDGFDSMLKNSIPDVVLSNKFVSSIELDRTSAYSGVITGSFSIQKSVIDDIISFVEGKEAIIGLIALPIYKEQAKLYSRDIVELYNKVNAFDDIKDRFSNTNNINISRTFSGLTQLKDFTNKQFERIIKSGNELWESCIWFGSSEEDFSRELGRRIVGILNSADVSEIEKGRYYLTSHTPFKDRCLAISNDFFGDVNIPVTDNLLKGSLKSWVTTDEVASLFQLPTRSHPGITVLNSNKNANDLHAFETNVPKYSECTIELGNESVTKQKFLLALSDFTGHALITGATGFGKTNTVKVLLNSFYRHNIPFCVIEASKKEYWHLISSVYNLKVYSSGFDAEQLRINPLEPEDGIILSNHINDVMYALSGAFEMEEATRLSFFGLINYTYEKYGWELNEIAYKQKKSYPTFYDLLINLDEYSRTSIGSGTEVTANIKGSLQRRLELLTSGTVGNIVNTQNGIDGKTLCDNYVLIELDDLSLDIKPFISTILLVKMNQYLRQKDSAKGQLKNIVVLEEAHNVIPAVSNVGKITAKDISSKYFSNMLSQIRDFGTGIIVADQGASQINSTTIANTKIKIAHAISQEMDADAEAYALHINHFQKELLPELSTGEAIVSITSKAGTYKVEVNTNRDAKLNNIACIFCKQRRICEFNIVISRMSTIENYELFITKVYNDRYETNVLKLDVDNYFNRIGLQKSLNLCALGYMLSNCNISCGEREKRRIIYRYLY